MSLRKRSRSVENLLFRRTAVQLPIVFHDFLLQFLLLPVQIVDAIGETLLLVMVVLLVFERVGQQLVVLRQQLRHVIHQGSPVNVQTGIHLQ